MQSRSFKSSETLVRSLEPHLLLPVIIIVMCIGHSNHVCLDCTLKSHMVLETDWLLWDDCNWLSWKP
jgi:hypothetical protein